jgi:D-serine deaminase-like pyridoxal phosphate-dependent protein
MPDYEWYTIDDIDNLDTPALVVYPARVKANIGMLKAMIDHTSRLRPHIKTYKNREVTQMLLDAGISKFKCATIAEAELLGLCKAPDVLLAYQPVGPKLQRFVQVILAYPDTKFSCLVDNVEAAIGISEAAAKNRVRIDVFIDLNVGMNRTGILPGSQVIDLYANCALLPEITPVGLHAYDGHIHDEDFIKRAAHCNKAFEPVSRLQASLTALGYPEPVIVAGGSPTFPIHAKRKNIECSPGTFVYWDEGYKEELSEQVFMSAALVISRVVSLPDETKICLDLGHKSVASEKELSKRVYFLNAPELVMCGHSEEHLVADAGTNHRYKVGDVLYGVPYHICPTVALYERAITIDGNKGSGEWKNIARDRKITI